MHLFAEFILIYAVKTGAYFNKKVHFWFFVMKLRLVFFHDMAFLNCPSRFYVSCDGISIDCYATSSFFYVA